MAMKLDMSKAYNRVEWIFLESIMRKMGFPGRWVELVMATIKFVSYSILINGVPRGFIKPTRGFAEVILYLPHLFLLCSEGLNGLLKEAVAAGDLRGFSLCKNGPQVSHLFFADGSLIFFRVKMGGVQSIQSTLAKYERASGQKINGTKTNLFFGKSILDSTKTDLKNFLGVPEIKEYEKYLGLPAMVGRKKKESFIYIKERIWEKLQGWKEKLLSQVGREVLLKAIVQAISTFAMSCFQLPMSLCHEIEVLIKNFFWGQCGERQKIHWKNWESLCLPKIEGGMGFKELRKFNDAMLAKQVWRLVHDKESLFYWVFKAMFFPLGDIFSTQVKSESYAWQSILKARYLIAECARYRVGSGQTAKFIRIVGYQGKGQGNSGSALGSTNEVNRKIWSSLWRLEVPNKIKTFAWRVCTKSLPTLVNLASKKVVLSNSCTSCNREPETVIHALWGCEKVAWGTNFDELCIATYQTLSFVDLFKLVLQNPHGPEGFIMVCWFI
ncbi:uncharacterized protein LOC136065684 [Quercus suber]|uniref:uncharacterized protein LOC136065684 n=1 Tax=Quercus suber TaxID=58331 RepID=UPI0032DE3016